MYWRSGRRPSPLASFISKLGLKSRKPSLRFHTPQWLFDLRSSPPVALSATFWARNARVALVRMAVRWCKGNQFTRWCPWTRRWRSRTSLRNLASFFFKNDGGLTKKQHSRTPKYNIPTGSITAGCKTWTNTLENDCELCELTWPHLKQLLMPAYTCLKACI